MSDYYLRTGIEVTPIEEVTLSNGLTKVKYLDSLIGDSGGSNIEMALKTTSTILYKKNIGLTATTTLDNLMSNLISTDEIHYLYIKLVSDSGEVGVRWFTGTDMALWNNGDFISAKLGDSQGQNTVAASDIILTLITGTAYVDIMVVKGELI